MVFSAHCSHPFLLPSLNTFPESPGCAAFYPALVPLLSAVSSLQPFSCAICLLMSSACNSYFKLHAFEALPCLPKTSSNLTGILTESSPWLPFTPWLFSLPGSLRTWSTFWSLLSLQCLHQCLQHKECSKSIYQLPSCKTLFRQSLTLKPWLAWKKLCRPWLWTHRYLPPSASGAPELKASTTTPDFTVRLLS